MTWGKKITTRFFLNTKLQPVKIDGLKQYPLYVRVICKQQVSQFKYFGKDLEPKFFSEQEFDETFGTINFDDESGWEKNAIGISYYNRFQRDVNFLMNFLNVFERDKFTIKEFPAVLKNYYQLEKLVLKISSRALVAEMMRLGYSPLIPIIDWNHHPAGIEAALQAVQGKLQLEKTIINREALPFYDVRQLLEMIDASKGKDQMRKQILSNLKGAPGGKDAYVPLIDTALSKAFEFKAQAFKLTKEK